MGFELLISTMHKNVDDVLAMLKGLIDATFWLWCRVIRRATMKL